LSNFVINITRLPEGIREYQFEDIPGAIGLDDRFHYPVTVAVALTRSFNQFLIRARIQTIGTLECDRCLESFLMPIETDFSMVYSHENLTDLDIPSDSEFQVLKPDANIIDLGDDVRQYIQLAVPQKLLCKEDCAGICPNCGKILNSDDCTCPNEEVDSPWEVLRRITIAESNSDTGKQQMN
jgi:uncharacterized protein